MLKDLIKLADNLDKSGLAKEANYLDKLIIKLSQEAELTITSWDGEVKTVDNESSLDHYPAVTISGTINGKSFTNLKVTSFSSTPRSFSPDDYCLVEDPAIKIIKWYKDSQFGDINISDDAMYKALLPYDDKINEFINEYKEEVRRGYRELDRRESEYNSSRPLTEKEIISVIRAHFNDRINFKLPDAAIAKFVGEGSMLSSDLPPTWNDAIAQLGGFK